MSIVHVTGGSGAKIAADRTLFVGARIPEEIQIVPKHLKLLDKATFRKLLQAIVLELEGKSPDPATFQNLVTDPVPEETLAIAYRGVRKILQSALKLPQSLLKQETFTEDLQELKIPTDFIPDLASVVYGSRRGFIDKHSIESRPRLPKLENLRWRVDVGISTSVLSRALEPVIRMEMVLSDGKISNFEVPVSVFHDLRYNVAFVLKEMEDLEKKSILKIQA